MERPSKTVTMYPLSLWCVAAWLSLSVVRAQPIVPTLWGVKDCTYAIDFNLKDVNPKSDRYGEEYGLYYSEKTDVILVGMYMADSADSGNNAKRQQELGQELMDMGYTVKNVLLNYYAPLGCVMEGECVSFWWNNPFLFPGSDNCAGYVSGCAPNDERLTYAKWQGLLADAVDLPIFQDYSPGWAWDEFGGLQGDLFIYDREGRLYRYLCNIANVGAQCDTPLIGGGLQDDHSYETARNVAVEAAESDSDERCGEDVVLSPGYDQVEIYDNAAKKIYYVDDYYYYADFATSNDESGKNKNKVISVSRRHTHHRIQHKVPTYVYAGAVALFATIVTFVILYYRWKRTRPDFGPFSFQRLATEDPGEMRGSNPFGASKSNDYGSL